MTKCALSHCTNPATSYSILCTECLAVNRPQPKYKPFDLADIQRRCRINAQAERAKGNPNKYGVPRPYTKLNFSTRRPL